MTAEIVVMNREAVVLAADSAVTIGDGQKILNTANKVFMVIPRYPVGLLVYNNATLMGMPWEIIIKEYRDYVIKNSIEFSDLEEYAFDFLGFIESNGAKLIKEEQELSFINSMIYTEYGEILRAIWSEIRNIFYDKAEISDEEINQIVSKIIKAVYDRWIETDDLFPKEKADDLRNRLQEKFSEVIIEVIKSGFEKFTLSDENQNKLREIALLRLSKKDNKSPYTGIVFAGYGKENLYPVCVSLEVHSFICDVLTYTVDTKSRVGFSKGEVSSIILPFAQQDVAHNILQGRLPYYEFKLRESLVKKFDEDEVEKILEEVNNETWKAHTQPILDIVDLLPKEELASVARTLVNLTSFMRHVSSDIETVGGPVDVAVISKKDGFIWINRKHYFNIENNIHFAYEGIGGNHVSNSNRNKEESQ